MKKRIENISSVIEDFCKKKIVFILPLLPFGRVRVANARCTHLQIAQADPQNLNLQKSAILPMLDSLLKPVPFLMILIAYILNSI